MSAFTSRTATYKAGVGLLFLVTAVYIVGFGAPYWASAESGPQQVSGYWISYSYNEGLWMLCVSADTSIASASGCATYGISGLPAWFHVVRVLEAMCLSGLVIACIYALATNCCRTFPGPRTRILEMLSTLAGIVGFAGCLVYVGMLLSKETDSTTSLSEFTILFYTLYWDFDWALYLAAIGSGLSVIAAIVIGVGNKPVGDLPPGAGMVMTTVTAQPGYAPQPMAPQPYVGGSYPGAPPQPYVAQPGYNPNKAGYPAPY